MEPLAHQVGVFSLVQDVGLFKDQCAGTSKGEVGGCSLVEVRMPSFVGEVWSIGEVWLEVRLYSKVQHVAEDWDEVIFQAEDKVTFLGTGRTTSLVEVKTT